MDAPLGSRVLAVWLREHERSMRSLSRELHVNPALVSQWLHGQRKMPARYALMLDRVTHGAVSPGMWTIARARRKVR